MSADNGAFYEIDPARLTRKGLQLLGQYEMLDKWIGVLLAHASQAQTSIVEGAILKKIANSLAIDLEKCKRALAIEAEESKAAVIHTVEANGAANGHG
jgi:hypothetical protein